MKKHDLEPLIPLDDLKDVVRGLIAVPKDHIAKPGAREKKKARKPRKR